MPHTTQLSSSTELVPHTPSADIGNSHDSFTDHDLFLTTLHFCAVVPFIKVACVSTALHDVADMH